MERLLGETYTDISLTKPQNKPLNKQVHEGIENCNLCKRHQHSKPITGLFNPTSKLAFITLTPMLDSQLHFLNNLKAAMLESIIQKVFNYPLKDCNILSLLKCDSNSLNLEEEINACLPHLIWQLDNSTSKVIVVFGEILPKRLLNLSKEESFGRIVSLKSKHFLSTYALEDMLKNPTLKKKALAHFKIALQFLNQS
ncbi:uracil-DNA glycosylase family protein [Helicobacter pylori]|uniref:Uracil-DNA glycosylase, family 4 n=1 Tax=Helicobacter pylori HP260AFii TaxID=1159077 RepID=A0ABC9S8E5_HELPX|nr:uracil-DNA glycosylase family protein [Helicobacter pylori]EMH21054.1 uracil-DNA glycosylase, family 4 [Helicobacter pylori GAM260ASi]EMH31184.1 uracil-DNA glycosylase, family 4 [Helicobacter pylori GAM268Bii]EMH62605.1 uracil-DNA glycosylase, family 4 [Helicobacter pylori HP260AFi]EMH65251.1 uracil-DNA glycosylase, family 4 [Helicobacter pylori HP260AFii]EMH69679.1 uracil-DNA glycosylase, family 4 [Helicobacter pylori HP260ASii]